jgi:uncharacterized protein (UPF0147 family)
MSDQIDARTLARRYSVEAIEVLNEVMRDTHAPDETRRQAATTIITVAAFPPPG